MYFYLANHQLEIDLLDPLEFGSTIVFTLDEVYSVHPDEDVIYIGAAPVPCILSTVRINVHLADVLSQMPDKVQS